MPDDKIHIELQAEELELLRKQATAAGVDNLSDFARQRLVTLLLSLEQSGLPDVTPASTKEAFEKVRAELKRLHGEIQDFVAETAAASSPEPETILPAETSEPETPIVAPFTPPFPFARPFGIPGLGLGGSAGRGFPLGLPRQRPAFGPNKPSDELEEMAGKAFSISPRLKTDEGNPPAEKPPVETTTFNASPVENPQWPTQPAQPVQFVQPVQSTPTPQLEVSPLPSPPVELPIEAIGEETVAVDPDLLKDDPLGDLLDKALLEKRETLDASALSALAGEITVAADQHIDSRAVDLKASDSSADSHESVEAAEELPPKPDNVIQAQFWDDAANSESESVSSNTNTLVKEESTVESSDPESVQSAQNESIPSDPGDPTSTPKPKISGISGNIPPRKRRS
jgi:hypothetical protein